MPRLLFGVAFVWLFKKNQTFIMYKNILSLLLFLEAVFLYFLKLLDFIGDFVYLFKLIVLLSELLLDLLSACPSPDL